MTRPRLRSLRESTAGDVLATADAAALPASRVLELLGSSANGLTKREAATRLATVGPNALRAHGVRPWTVLARQFRSYLLLLLVGAAAVSAAVGSGTEAAIILAIVALSVGLGFLNEYRSEQAVEALHSQIHRRAVVTRDGVRGEVDVTALVPGDVVDLHVGDVVAADLRLLEASGLECDESVLTGESAPAAKTTEAVSTRESPLDLPCVAFMGTIVRGGGGRGVVVRTGMGTEFGAIAARLGERHEETAFQRGLRDFSRMLVTITGALAGSIFVINLVFGRGLLEALLFALAIAVGLTPQLLPAIVTVSLATGARRLAARQVVVKRLVSIEDLGNVEVLFTDKTGTLTEGRIVFEQAVDSAGVESQEVLELGLAVSDRTGNALDRALWESDAAATSAPAGWSTLATAPFDHERQLGSALIDTGAARLLVAKGAPEAIIARCDNGSATASSVLDGFFAA